MVCHNRHCTYRTTANFHNLSSSLRKCGQDTLLDQVFHRGWRALLVSSSSVSSLQSQGTEGTIYPTSSVEPAMKRAILLLLITSTFAIPQQKRAIGLEIQSGEPIPVAVDELSKSAAKLGLTQSAITERIAAHLQKIGVQTSRINKGEYLSVDVEVDDKSYGVVLKFRRVGSFNARNQKFEQHITSWIVYSFGSHNGRARPILDSIDENVGYFIQGFRLANPNY